MPKTNITILPDKSFENKYCIHPRMGGDGKMYKVDIASYSLDQGDLLHEVTRPFNFGWVKSQAACLERRTKEEFIKMFQINDNNICFGLMGFRNIEEGLLCEAAALAVGSSWRFINFYRQQKQFGRDGLGCLNIALAEYAKYYVHGLLPDRFPAPPSPNDGKPNS